MKKARYYFHLMEMEEMRNFTAEFERNEYNIMFADMVNISIKDGFESFLDEFFNGFEEFIKLAFDVEESELGVEYWMPIINKYRINKMKKFKCKNESCGRDYEKKKPLQRACSARCESQIVGAKKKKKEERQTELKNRGSRELKAWKESAQTICNSYIRLRDKGKPCVTCGKIKKLQAGHLFSQGAHSAVRYDEDNIHGQCFECNASSKFDAGKYIEEMIKRTSEAEFEVLRAKAYEPKKWEVSELKAIQSYYLTKIKELANGSN